MEAVSGITNYTSGASGMITTVINSQTKLDNGNIVVVDSAGQIRLSKTTMQPMTVSELRDEIITNTPSLIQAKTSGGTGAVENQSNGKFIDIADYENKSSEERAEIRKTMTTEEINELLK